jgi:hypothetical protein
MFALDALDCLIWMGFVEGYDGIVGRLYVY